jgi:acyl-CoA synthetase (AMP-forming)/AMP-acid ligase II
MRLERSTASAVWSGTTGHPKGALVTHGKHLVRFPEQLVETAVTSHYRQGGIDVDVATM